MDLDDFRCDKCGCCHELCRCLPENISSMDDTTTLIEEYERPNKGGFKMDYWKECIADGAEECGLTLTDEQLTELAASVALGHEHYGMAFYSPSSSDRLNDIERVWNEKYAALQSEFDAYRGNAELAVKRALHQRSDESVSIRKYGEVFRHGGRTEQIQ